MWVSPEILLVAAILIIVGALAFLVGIVWLIVASFRHRSGKRPGIVTGLAFGVMILGVILASQPTYRPGDPGSAKAAEKDTMQTAMDSMMVDKEISAVTANTGIATNNFAATPIDGPLGSLYLRTTTTLYYYCWESNGMITQQFESAKECQSEE